MRNMVFHEAYYDGKSSNILRNKIFKIIDPRAIAIEFVSQYHHCLNFKDLPITMREKIALDCLHVYAPIGRALGFCDNVKIK